MIKTTIHGENNEVSRLQKVLDCYYFCHKTGKINLDGSEEEVKIYLELEEKEAIDGLTNLEKR